MTTSISSEAFEKKTAKEWIIIQKTEKNGQMELLSRCYWS